MIITSGGIGNIVLSTKATKAKSHKAFGRDASSSVH